MRGKSRNGQDTASPVPRAAKNGVSRRTVLKAGASAGVAAAFGGVAGWMATSARRVTADPPSPPKGPDLILWNGKIHTMDDKNTVVSEVAIKEGRFVVVGQGAVSHQGAGTQVVILQGFTGPTTPNTLGKQFFQANGVTVNADGSILTNSAPNNTGSGRAMNLLRQTLLRTAADGFERRKQSVLDAMAYALTVGVTTHLDQGA